MNRLFPENSYMGKCACGAEFIAPKGMLHCHWCLYEKISKIESKNKDLECKIERLAACLTKSD